MPQSSDDYGDFEGPIEPPKPDTQPLDGSAIGGLISDVIGGALNLFGAGVEILSEVIDGNVRKIHSVPERCNLKLCIFRKTSPR